MPTIPEIERKVFETARQGTKMNPGVSVDLANLIVAQTKHETATTKGNLLIPYTSNVFTSDNNAIGYKWVGSKYQIGPGLKAPEGDYYGRYASYQDSIKELVDWLYRRQNEGVFPDLATVKTSEEYAMYLKEAGYYGDTSQTYAARLKEWLGKLIDEAPGTWVVSGLLLILLGYGTYRFLNPKKGSNIKR